LQHKIRHYKPNIMQQKYYKRKQIIAIADSAKQLDEIVEHNISACPILAKEQYIKT